MMCFRDQTFCPFHEDCANADTCCRPLTDEVRAAAREWWGGDDVPIAVFTSKPDCHVEVCPHDPQHLEKL